ncbi:MAG: ClbS/DfsB family four-helix bundle protein [Clostridiales bacterium]|jgi:hypothetical protein|nr:ClbS/DfsB family four-helix bundle protein [Clostridiales bacterium]
MARATTKADLIKTANGNFDRLFGLIETMSETEQNATFKFGAEAGKEAHWGRDKNIRDVLIHLYEWHRLLLKWIEANTKGESKPFLPEPYNWKTYGQMNVGFWEKHQSTPYKKAEEMLKDSHARVMSVIEKFTDEELFEKAHFKWTGTSSLGQYCVSVTASHYDWATVKVKLHIKTIR